ncbi:hypothetical protein [Mixta sp. Marseille-Q2659]|uniref:hypothetical protein n=1 Tax=Mixta sp. Marseille-Q2659 TaxID=2736607 RepID=UPI0023B9AB8B|nr:hypothetical protein [Mixta sp. Marseille-Q2659]
MSVADMNELNITRINAEIAKLMAETQKLNEESVKLARETEKLKAESGKLTRETFWYPVAVASGLVGTVAAVTTFLIKMI